jgi:exopolysaccharide biosynthesis polyprenyl glycosylphosphotransferase
LTKYLSLRYTLFLFLCDMGFVLLALYLSSVLRRILPFGRDLLPSSTILSEPIYLFALLIWSITFLLTDVYSPKQTASIVRELQGLAGASVVAWLSVLGFLFLTFRDTSRVEILYFLIVYILLICCHRIGLRSVFKLRGGHRFRVSNVAIVGTNDLANTIAKDLSNYQWVGLKFVGFINHESADEDKEEILGNTGEIKEIIERHAISEVIFALDPHIDLALKQLVYDLQPFPVNVRVVPDYFDLVFLRTSIEEFGGVTLLTLKEPALTPFERFIKRAFDLLLTSLILIPTLPLMLIIALLIWLDDAGSPLFLQERVAEGGRLFKMYKFRTMIEDAESHTQDIIQTAESGEILHKFPGDPRVTRIGRFLRRFSLDELPQVFNILRGDMSLVGPRPEMPWMVEMYQPWQRKRFEVPQGLTGWWQINGRAERPMHIYTEADLYYIRNYSLWLDITILWRTFEVVISGRGAY